MHAPVKGKVPITQAFGGNRYGEARDVPHNGGTIHVFGHTGLDFGVRAGTPVLACWPGRVTHGFEAGGFGLYAVLTTADGRTALYGHLSAYSTPDGTLVGVDQEIAKSGYSGDVRPPGPDGAHLHFEVKDARPDFLNGYRGCRDPITGFDHGVIAEFDLSLV